MPVRPVSSALDDAFDRAAAILSGASSVALSGHVNPDPDAIGSMLGVAGFLRTRGADVVCSWPNVPMELPRWLDVVPERPPIVDPREFPSEPAVMVALDTASKDRLASLAAAADRARELIVLDHHVTNPGFGTVAVIDPHASSTAEVAYRLIERMGGARELTQEDAACLYAGILTDTGRFQYGAATPETLRVAAALRDTGFDHVALGQRLFEDGSYGYLRLLGVVLSRVRLEPEAGVVWAYALQSDFQEAGVPVHEADDLIDVVRVAREADVACVVRQQRDGRFKVSLRSRGASDVGSIAAANGGGGHRLAAGYTARGGLAETVADVVRAVREQRG
jgi:phosphoesterase RecJ-like protein